MIAPAGTIHGSDDVASRSNYTYKALVDTGADHTCISRKIAHEVGLRVTGKIGMASASRDEEVNLYIADVYVPVVSSGEPGAGLVCNSAQLMEVRDDHRYQALLGRDVLELVVFTLDGPNKCFTLDVPFRFMRRKIEPRNFLARLDNFFGVAR